MGSPKTLGGNTISDSDPLQVALLVGGSVVNPAAPVMGAGENHLGEVGGRIVTVSTEFTRPADTTAYAANDIVSDSTSATTIQQLTNVARVSGGSGYIVGAALTTNLKSITPRFRVTLFNVVGATVSNDNAASKSVYADLSKRAGSFDLAALATSADATNSDQSRVVDFTLRIPFVTAGSRNLFFVLETLDAFTPASGEKFTLTLWIDEN